MKLRMIEICLVSQVSSAILAEEEGRDGKGTLAQGGGGFYKLANVTLRSFENRKRPCCITFCGLMFCCFVKCFLEYVLDTYITLYII